MTTIKIEDGGLAGVIQQAQEQIHPIMCKGASQTSEAVPAFVQIRKMPQFASNKNAVIYVLCPRFKSFLEQGLTVERCYEGDPTQYETFEKKGEWEFDKELNDSMMAASRKCPYFKR